MRAIGSHGIPRGARSNDIGLAEIRIVGNRSDDRGQSADNRRTIAARYGKIIATDRHQIPRKAGHPIRIDEIGPMYPHEPVIQQFLPL